MPKTAQIEDKYEHDTAVERSTERLTEIARATARAGEDVARESVNLARSTTAATEDLYEATRKSAEESTEIGRGFAELLGEQTRQTVDTVNAVARAVNWTDVVQAQSKLLAGSFLRFSQFNARYGQFLLRGVTATAMSPRR